MKKYCLFLFLGGLLLVSFIQNKSNVFICDSNTSYAYHLTPNCKGLNRCTHAIVEITKENAKKEGRSRCKIEY